MKKATIISSILFASLLLTACDKENQLKSEINKKINQNYKCLHIRSSSIFSAANLPQGLYKKYQSENTALIIKLKKDNEFIKDYQFYDKDEEKKLNTLVEAGLLEKTEETQPVIDTFSKEPIKNETFVITLYNSTKMDKETVKNNTVFPDQETFCYAHPEVDKILNYKQMDVGGQKMAEIKYSYKYTDIAKWAKNKDVQAQFPEIKSIFDDKDKIAVITLVKTNNGWEVRF